MDGQGCSRAEIREPPGRPYALLLWPYGWHHAPCRCKLPSDAPVAGLGCLTGLRPRARTRNTVGQLPNQLSLTVLHPHSTPNRPHVLFAAERGASSRMRDLRRAPAALVEGAMAHGAAADALSPAPDRDSTLVPCLIKNELHPTSIGDLLQPRDPASIRPSTRLLEGFSCAAHRAGQVWFKRVAIFLGAGPSTCSG